LWVLCWVLTVSNKKKSQRWEEWWLCASEGRGREEGEEKTPEGVVVFSRAVVFKRDVCAVKIKKYP